MDLFPSLAPTARVFSPGDIPNTRQVALSGVSTAYRLGNRRIQQTLDLSFEYLTEAQMSLIKNHYFAANGSYDIFFLSASIWGDFDSPPVPVLSDIAWRYSSPPTIEDVSFDRFTVNVALVSYAIDFSDLIVDGGAAAATPARTYILDAGAASATPARDYVINPGAAA